jgi:hypothetical protein
VFSEPEAALFLLDHPNNFQFAPQSNIVVRLNRPGPGNVPGNWNDLYNIPFPDGTNYVRITKLGDALTFQVDHTYSPSRFDSLTVTALIPEPETYALLFAGLGLLGFASRTRARRGEDAMKLRMPQ